LYVGCDQCVWCHSRNGGVKGIDRLGSAQWGVKGIDKWDLHNGAKIEAHGGTRRWCATHRRHLYYGFRIYDDTLLPISHLLKTRFPTSVTEDNEDYEDTEEHGEGRAGSGVK